MNKPRLHMFRGRWYCVGSGVGFGGSPLVAYQNWLCCTTAFKEVLEADARAPGVHYTNRGREYGYSH